MAQEDDIENLRERRRFDRQFNYIAQLVPGMQRPITAIRARGWWVVRLPLAILLILGGVLSFLPVLGIWMLPLGLLLLAVDLRLLRGPISVLLIRARQRMRVWRRWWQMKRH